MYVYIFFRNDIEGKHYMDQLMTRQTTWLASENSRYGLSEEVNIKYYMYVLTLIYFFCF